MKCATRVQSVGLNVALINHLPVNLCKVHLCVIIHIHLTVSCYAVSLTYCFLLTSNEPPLFSSVCLSFFSRPFTRLRVCVCCVCYSINFFSFALSFSLSRYCRHIPTHPTYKSPEEGIKCAPWRDHFLHTKVCHSVNGFWYLIKISSLSLSPPFLLLLMQLLANFKSFPGDLVWEVKVQMAKKRQTQQAQLVQMSQEMCAHVVSCKRRKKIHSRWDKPLTVSRKRSQWGRK